MAQPADGVAHLRAIARTPRAAGSIEEREARAYCAASLGASGFDVSIEPFSYSAFPGRYATPVAGAIAATTVLAAAWLAVIEGAPRAAALAAGAGLLTLALFAWSMMGESVLDLPWLRAEGENLVARRGRASPRVWLVAHVDSKSQPLPTRLRMAGLAVLGASVVLTLVAVAVTLGGGSSRTVLWTLCAVLAVPGGCAVMASIVRNDAAGAVDNASGVAAVLSAAATLDDSAAVGVVITSAEELGLAGARAWVRAHGTERGFVMNCDGVDDQGELTLMYTRTKPEAIVNAVRRATGRLQVRRMPPGLLLDSVAFADAGWIGATLSHGSMRTLARVHTAGDSLDALRGAQIAPMAATLARAAEALAR